MLLVPLLVLFVTPLIRPFRWRRLVLTYLIPVLPLAILWDGLVSALRTYSVEEMKDLVSEFPSYDWTVKVMRSAHGESLPTLVGVPKP